MRRLMLVPLAALALGACANELRVPLDTADVARVDLAPQVVVDVAREEPAADVGYDASPDVVDAGASDVADDSSLDAAPDESTDATADVTLSGLTSGDDVLMIVLTWQAPADPDPTDIGFGLGPDLDLHLLHPNGCWGDELWDCHFRAWAPDWGEHREQDDDPSLDLDSTDGSGPEVIRLPRLESDARYVVGVHVYRDHGFGPSIATVRIYFHGELMYEQDRILPATNTFWEVARIDWPDRVLRVVDQVTDAVPTCE